MQQVSSSSSGGSLRQWNLFWHTKRSYGQGCCWGQSNQLGRSLKRLRLFGFLVLAFLLILPCTALAMVYGETGPYRVIRESFKNPLSNADVTVFLPENAKIPMPVMFFAHGLGGNYYQAYKSLLTHVASQGVAVVFSPYPSNTSWSQQYEVLWSGFSRAAYLYRYEFDLDNVGFFGHSWGGGATPNMALRGLQQGWGQVGMLMFIMAPAPAYGVSNQDLQSMTDATLIMQVYENDTNAPHQVAKDIYMTLGIPIDYKAYYFVQGADHSIPSERSVDDYDRLAIWTPLDALMDFTFRLDRPSAGRRFALDGYGDHYRTIVMKDPTENDDSGGTTWRDWLDRFRNR